MKMEVGEDHYGKVLSSADEVAGIMSGVLALAGEFDQDKEHFWTIGLDVKNSVKYIELCGLGTLDGALVHPREVFRPAIARSVSKIVICHNHPSGDTHPSLLDQRLTARLKEAGEIIGINLVDHVIISAEGAYLSLDKEGLL
jgi:DNA repair protein RadC